MKKNSAINKITDKNKIQQALKLEFNDSIESDKIITYFPADSTISAPYPSFWTQFYRPDSKQLDYPNYKEKYLIKRDDGRYFKVTGGPFLPTVAVRDYLVPLMICSRIKEDNGDYCLEVAFEPYLKLLNITNDYNNRKNICNTLLRSEIYFETNLTSKSVEDSISFKFITAVETEGKHFRVFFNSRYADLKKIVNSRPKLMHYMSFKTSIAKSLYLVLVNHLSDNYAIKDKAGNTKQITLYYMTLSELLDVCNLDHWKRLERKYFRRNIDSVLMKGIKELMGNNSKNNFYNCFTSKNIPDFQNAVRKSDFKLGHIDNADIYDLNCYYIFTRGQIILDDFPFSEKKIAKELSEK